MFCSSRDHRLLRRARSAACRCGIRDAGYLRPAARIINTPIAVSTSARRTAQTPKTVTSVVLGRCSIIDASENGAYTVTIAAQAKQITANVTRRMALKASTPAFYHGRMKNPAGLAGCYRGPMHSRTLVNHGPRQSPNRWTPPCGSAAAGRSARRPLPSLAPACPGALCSC